MKRLFVIAGWYLDNTDFYSKIISIKKNENIDVFISSHKPIENISNGILDLLQKNNVEIQFFANEGFDWGAYSQAVEFLGEKIHKYTYIYFMHDDLIIKNINFLLPFEKQMNDKNLLILGNSINLKDGHFKKTHPHIIEWAKRSKWNIDIKSDSWSTARGSFFIAKSIIFKKIKSIPYKTGHKVGFGNWSLRLFFGLLEDNFGKNKVDFYSSEYLTSEYIDEYERGQKTNKTTKDIIELYNNQIELPLNINLFCGLNYMDGYLNFDEDANSFADLNEKFENINFNKEELHEIIISDSSNFNLFEKENISKLYNWLIPGGQLKISIRSLNLRPNIIKKLLMQDDLSKLKHFFKKHKFEFNYYNKNDYIVSFNKNFE